MCLWIQIQTLREPGPVHVGIVQFKSSSPQDFVTGRETEQEGRRETRQSL